MFKCQKCGQTSKRYEKQQVIIVSTRPKTYYHFILSLRKDIKEIQTTDLNVIQPYTTIGWKVIKRKITKGWEIEKEIKVCTECYKKLTEEKNV